MAARERIFHAFVEPAEIVHWLPPAGARAILHAFEPRAGGDFRMTLVFADSSGTTGKTSTNSDTINGRFLEVTPPSRIAQQFTFVSDEPQFAGTMMMTWTLEETPDGTCVTVIAENVPPGISPEDHQLGMASSLENLARYVER